jgi:hypothetical protein
VPWRVADEEDVVLSAFNSLFRGLAAGHFPRLADRDDLWALLVAITAAKASDLRQCHKRRRRGGGKVGGEPVLDAAFGDPEGGAGINQVVGAEPTPEVAAQVAEEFERRLAVLPSDEVHRVAVWKMGGYTNAEIPAELGGAEATVARRPKLILDFWGKPPSSEPDTCEPVRGGAEIRGLPPQRFRARDRRAAVPPDSVPAGGDTLSGEAVRVAVTPARR